MIRETVKRIANTVFPPGSRARKKIRQIRENWRARQSYSLSYEIWLKEVEATIPAPSVLSEGLNPLISIVVPAFNTPDKYLNPLLDSIISQSYQRWELVLVQASTIEERAAAIRQAARRDGRIKVIELEKNQGIAGNTNAGLNAAKGEFIAFLDHDDTLSPYALASVVEALQANREIGLFYSDEDKLSDDGMHRSLPFFKPAWSPELFLGVNYLAHFVVVRADLVREIGGIRLGYDGAQDYDFLLRLTSLRPVVHAVSRMSYHWRQAVGSTGLNLSEKSYAADAGVRALADYVIRNNIPAYIAGVEGRPTEYRLKYRVAGQPSVAVIPTTGHSPAAFAELAKATGTKMRLIQNISEAREDELLLSLDLNLKPVSAEWLDELIGQAQQPGIAWVGGCLVTGDGRSCGVGYAAYQGALEPLFAALPLEQWTFMGPAIWARNVLAPNPHCALIEVSKLRRLSSADLTAAAVQAPEAGFRNVYWPYARLIGSTMLSAVPQPAGFISKSDLYINPNLVLRNGDFILLKRKH